MYGAIIGDICGSRYEGSRNYQMNKYVELFPTGCLCTDDTVMTIAVAEAIMVGKTDDSELRGYMIEALLKWARKYPRAGYGRMFKAWFNGYKHEPYNSFGNGSAMRVSACGLAAKDMDEALRLAEISSEITHNHPEGIKGAKAIAACIYLAKTGATKEEIEAVVKSDFYPLDKNIRQYCDEGVRGCTCMATVPVAISAFLESEDFEDAIRNAISVGGDTDTNAAMAGSIAWSYYKYQNHGRLTMEMDCMMEMAKEFIPGDMQKVVDDFEKYLKMV